MTAGDDDVPYKPRERRDVLSFMASLNTLVGDIRGAEGYLLELMACLTFTLQSSSTQVASS